MKDLIRRMKIAINGLKIVAQESISILEAAKQADMNRRRTQFEGLLARMKDIAEAK